MRQREIIIVGAGLFGSIAATLCRRAGHLVSVVDSGESWSASKASGCVLAPSWLSSLSKEHVAEAMETLNSLYTVHDLAFKTNVGATFKAKRVELKKVLVKPEARLKVMEVGNGWVEYDNGKDGFVKAKADKVLVAAGIGSASLVEMPVMRGLWGASVRFKAQLAQPRVDAYAPYRQAVAFQEDKDTVWFGDGTALIEKTWQQQYANRIKMTEARGAGLLGKLGYGPKLVPRSATAGARPYVEGHKDGYFAKVFPNTWVSTGGAKNGTVLAALQARMFLEAL